MDWQSIKDALGDAIFGETRSLARKTAVGAGILGLIYYFMPSIEETKSPLEDTVSEQEVQREWKSFQKSGKKGRRSPASVGASDSIAFRTTPAKDEKEERRTVSSSSNYTPPPRERLPDMPPRYESEDEDRDWVPMAEYSPPGVDKPDGPNKPVKPDGPEPPEPCVDCGPPPPPVKPTCSGCSTPTDDGTVCSFSKNPGTYSSPISVAIICDDSNTDVYYCVSTNGQECDPRMSGQLYAGAISLSQIGTNYYISYYGSQSGGHGVIKTGEFTIDPNSPSSSDSIACSVDKPEGVYGSSISVGISCSGTADIYYCVQTGGGSCDPSGGTLYSGPVALNLGDNIYDISFYARTSSYSTDIDSATYTIDSTLPNLVVDFPVTQTQTSEFPLENTTTSSDFGKSYNYYSQINLKSYNPGSASCRDIFDGYHLYSPAPSVIQGSTDVSPLNAMLDQIQQSLDLDKLVGGDNYIVTFMEDAERNLVSCQTQKVIVKDFHMAAFTGAGPTPVASGVRRIAGGFVSYGHFQANPSTPTTSGRSTNNQGSGVAQLVSGLWDIFY